MGKQLALLAHGKFRTLLADPPWQYGNTATRAAAANHYQTLSVEQIAAIDVGGRPVADLVGDQGHCYLWTTNGFLPQAFQILDAWKFDYKTCLTWVKEGFGIGNYFRGDTEHVLFGSRGGLGCKDRSQHNWFMTPRGRHSSKPDILYEIIEKASNGPYLELFARPGLLPPREGWTVWGNEA